MFAQFHERQMLLTSCSKPISHNRLPQRKPAVWPRNAVIILRLKFFLLGFNSSVEISRFSRFFPLGFSFKHFRSHFLSLRQQNISLLLYFAQRTQIEAALKQFASSRIERLSCILSPILLSLWMNRSEYTIIYTSIAIKRMFRNHNRNSCWWSCLK